MKELLTGKLPTSFQIGGKEYEIASDFRTMLELEAVFSASDLTDAEKGEKALRLFYGGIPEDVEAAVERLCFFWRGGRTETPRKRRRQLAGGDFPQRPVYAFCHDAGLIYAAFLTQYGIDLCEAEGMHWWKFLALFEGLEDDRLMKEVMRCRAVEIRGDMPQGQKDYYHAMKERYALPLPEGVEEQLSALEAALLGDGDISEVIGCRKEK